MFSKGSQQDSFKRSLPSTHEERKTETDSTAPRRGWQAWDLFPLSLLLKVCSNLYSPTNSLSKPTLFPRSYSLLKAGCHSSAPHHSGTLVSKLGCILSEQGSGKSARGQVHGTSHRDTSDTGLFLIIHQVVSSSPRTRGRNKD